MALTVAVNPSAASAAIPGWFVLWNSNSWRAWCLDVQAETAGNVRTNIQIYRCSTDESPGGNLDYQLFTGVDTYYGIKFLNKATNKCLTYNVNGVPSSSPAKAVWAESCNKNGQGWRPYSSSFPASVWTPSTSAPGARASTCTPAPM